jgi:hypothetical protein
MRILVDDQPVTLAAVSELPVPDPATPTEPTTEETRLMENDSEIQITRLRLNHFRGWDQVDVDVGPGGTIFSGEDASGKTSFLLAIRAVAEAEGIGPECLRFDAAKGEVLLDMVKVEQGRRTAMQAKRTIKRKGKGELELLGSDGVPMPQPAGQLGAMFGGRALNPLKIYEVMSDAKKLRQLIMSANPVTLTSADLNKWCETSQEWDVSGHGQEVLARVLAMHEGKRKTAGQASDQAKATVTLRTAEANQLRVTTPEPMTPEAALTHVEKAARDLAVLRDRRTQAEERQEAAEGTRAKIAALRAEAEEMMTSEAAVEPAAEDVRAAEEEQAAAAAALAEAQARLDRASNVVASLCSARTTARDLVAKATSKVAEANTLEEAIAGTEDMPALAEAMQASEAAKVEAEALLVRAEATAKWKLAKQALTIAEATQKQADEEWERLDRICKRLVKEAPAELASRSDMIPGLELTVDSVILDGKDITQLCGAERLKFAVTLTKRMAGRAKILTVDGMEAIPPGKQPGFVRMCLEGGWILFATIVADGPLQIVDAYTFANIGKAA